VPEQDALSSDNNVSRTPGVRGILAPGHWAYILLLLVPVAVVDLIFQAVRVLSPAGDGRVSLVSWQLLDALRSDLMFHIANIVFWVVVFAVVRGRVTRRVAAVLFHIWFTILSIFVVLTMLYFVLLDVMINVHSISLVKLIFQTQMFKIIQAEMQSFVPLLAIVAILVGNRFPVMVNRGRWQPRHLVELPQGGTAHFTRTRVIAVGAAIIVVSLTLSALPNLQGTTGLTRNRVVALPLQAVEKGLSGDPKGYREPTADDIPVDTRLVATDRTHQYNVVQIVLESQGWQATTLGTPELDTTPVLSELAGRGLSAQRAFTAMPHTSKSLTASNCGVAPPLDTENTEAEPGGTAARCLPDLLVDQGYATGFFQTATQEFENRDKVVKNFGYQDFFPMEAFPKKGFYKTNTLGYEDDLMLQPSLDWAKQQHDAGKPFSLEYMTLTAHSKYVLPEDRTYRDIVDDDEHNAYLNTIEYQDEFVGQVIDGFEKLGLADNTIFVIMGDHGEGFREHGRRLHNDTIWNEGIQIPLVVLAPGKWEDGFQLDAPVSNESVLPTIVDLLGYDIDGGEYPAPSLLEAPNSDNPVFTNCWDPDQCASVVTPDGHKYIHFFGYRPDEYYDLNVDPTEQDDLVSELSDAERDKFVERLRVFQAETNARHALSRSLAAS